MRLKKARRPVGWHKFRRRLFSSAGLICPEKRIYDVGVREDPPPVGWQTGCAASRDLFLSNPAQDILSLCNYHRHNWLALASRMVRNGFNRLVFLLMAMER
jgi:hypothetical protein